MEKTMTVIKQFNIGSDDDDLTAAMIDALPDAITMTADAEEFTDDVDGYYHIAYSLGYKTYYSELNEIVYFVK